MEELVEKVRGLGSAEELKPLLAKIAHNRAVSRLRELYAVKRGAGQTESYEAKEEACGDLPKAIAPDDPVGALEHKELAERLGRLLAELKPPQGEMLADYFLRGLTYEEIAKKHTVALGTVGVPETRPGGHAADLGARRKRRVRNAPAFQEFFDLALKVIRSRASDAEREQLEVLLASRPDMKTQFEEKWRIPGSGDNAQALSHLDGAGNGWATIASVECLLRKSGALRALSFAKWMP